MTTVRRALVSVHDKAGVVDFARGLAGLGVEICSTGGTARLLREAGVAVRDVAEVTGSPEILGGRVKTLHPKVHGGILARRGLASDLADLARHGIGPIDLVAVNLYPFEAAVARPGITAAEAIEEIDIGGVTLLRAAAKNHADVVVVSEPADYGPVLAELRAKGGATDPETRRALARKAFARTAGYDAAIGGWLTRDGAPAKGLPATLALAATKVADLKYGENPHQAAALYRDPTVPPGVAGATRLAGPDLSYNNCWDVAGALRCVGDVGEPAVVIVKHATPCGVARGADLADAVRRAVACDPISAFGGVVALNRPVDAAVAEALAAKGHFFEVIAAPDVAADALLRLTGRASWGDRVRILQTDPCPPRRGARLVRSLPGGFLVQDDDAGPAEGETAWRTVTRRAPTDAERRDLAFAWTVVKHVASNAIVLAAGDVTIGIGGGQTNRVDAVRGAVARAGERARGAVLASDAFFPFPDSIEVAAAAGVRAVIQPGGSKKDADAIAAADAAGMAMVVTGVRHFRH